MKLIVSDIPEEGIFRETEIPVKLREDAAPDMAEVSLKISRVEEVVLIEGTVKMAVKLECSRCLNEYSAPLDLRLREEYYPVSDMEEEREEET